MQWLAIMFAAFLFIGLRRSRTGVTPGRAGGAVVLVVAVTLAIWYVQMSTST
jgi:hypothetical protein